MRESHRVCRIAVVIAACVIVVSLSTSPGQDRGTYELNTQIYSVPTSQSDAARAIGANERLMERYMDLTERNFSGLAADLNILTAKIDAMGAGLAQLDQRLARIERHLGVAAVPPSAPARLDPNAPSTLASPSAATPPLSPR